MYQDRHPWNLALLGVWVCCHILLPTTSKDLAKVVNPPADLSFALQTTGLSVSVGVACSFYPTLVVLEALALTSLIVVSLTVYTFRAVRKGSDFTFMGPFLFTSMLPMHLRILAAS